MEELTRPLVGVFTLGGTIAMQVGDAGGAVPTLSASDLLEAVPGLGSENVELTVSDVLNKPSASLSFADIYGLADTISTGGQDMLVTDGFAHAGDAHRHQ